MNLKQFLKTPDGKLHKGWLIFMGLCLANFALYQTGFNSLFALPMANALGVTRAEIMFFTTVYAFGAAIASAVSGAFYANEKIPVRLTTTVAVLLGVVAYLLWAYCQNLIMVYIAGFLIPFSMQGIKIIGNTVFAVNWYAPNIRGTLTGVSACFQGAGGTVFPIIIQIAMNAYGYQAGYWILIAASCILVLPFCLFVFDRTPQDCGLMPLGYVEGGKLDKKVETESKFGMTLAQAMKTVPFWLIIVIVFALGMQNGYKSNFSGMATEFLGHTGMIGEDIALVAAGMVSVASMTDLIANLCVGFVNDRIGPMKTMFITLGIFLCFFVIMLLGNGQTWVYFVAAACFGVNGSMMRTPLPFTIREIFGTKHFGSIWGLCNAIKPWAAGVMATVIALCYDMSGTYTGVLLFGFVFAALVYVFYFVATRYIGKFDWNKQAEN